LNLAPEPSANIFNSMVVSCRLFGTRCKASIRIGAGWFRHGWQEQERCPGGGRGRHSPQAGSEDGPAHQGRSEGDPHKQRLPHPRREGPAQGRKSGTSEGNPPITDPFGVTCPILLRIEIRNTFGLSSVGSNSTWSLHFRLYPTIFFFLTLRELRRIEYPF